MLITEDESKQVKLHTGQVLKNIAKKVGGYDLAEFNQSIENNTIDEVPVKQLAAAPTN